MRRSPTVRRLRRPGNWLPTVLALSVTLCLASPAAAVTFVVNTTTDAVDAAPGNGVCATGGAVCSLRAAIQEANALAGADAITLPAGTYTLAVGGAPEDAAARGDLDVTGLLTLTGAGAATTIVDAAGLDRAFEIFSTATLSAVTIRGGSVSGCGGGIRNAGGLTLVDVILTANAATQGGGLCNDQPSTTFGAAAVLTNVTVIGNSASAGGGLANLSHLSDDTPYLPTQATVSLDQSTIAENAATDGGGVFILASGGDATVDVSASTIRDNTATGDGGGVALGVVPVIFPFTSVAAFHAVEATISGNAAARGGGIFGDGSSLERSSILANLATSGGGGIAGSAVLTDCTLSGNRSDGDGGAILAGSSDTYMLHGVTITANVADDDGNGSGNGGGISVPSGSAPRIHLQNTILAGNLDGGGEAPDCAGALDSTGHNLLGNPAQCIVSGDPTGNVAGLAPGLGALAANGGPTLTHALLPGSPALDAGAGCSPTDQRGVARPIGPSCDIGAVEQAYVAGACGNGGLDGGEACDDGNVRDGDCCNHLCQLEVMGTACSDGNPCTDDTCDGAGACVQAANTAPCSDGSVCTTGAEVCAAGTCTPGAPLVCADDGDPCTGCHPQNGCNHLGLTGPVCDDGNACTSPDVCDQGECEGTPTTDPCDDGNACTSPDACSAGQCVGTPTTVPCDDGDLCTNGDQCSNGACQPGPGLPCAGVCERCESAIGCTFAPRPDCRLPTQPRGAAVDLKNKPGGAHDALQWTWNAPGGTTAEELSIPSISPDYELCVFDETAGNASLVLGARPAIGLCGNASCWRNAGGASLYKDRAGSADGLTSIQLRAKSSRVKLQVKAKGASLLLPSMPLVDDPGVIVELRRRNGACWTSRFTTPTSNTAERFKSKSE